MSEQRVTERSPADYAVELSQAADEVQALVAGTKTWYQARRIWGLLLIAVAWGYNAAAARWGLPSVEIDVGALSASLDGLLGAVGFALAWWGSWKAAKPVTWRKP